MCRCGKHAFCHLHLPYFCALIFWFSQVPLSSWLCQQYKCPVKPNASKKHRAPVYSSIHLTLFHFLFICWYVWLCVLLWTFWSSFYVCCTYLSSSISRLDSLSDSCLHRASLRSISLWSFLCSRMFSSLMCRSSSIYWARFSVSESEHWDLNLTESHYYYTITQITPALLLA